MTSVCAGLIVGAFAQPVDIAHARDGVAGVPTYFTDLVHPPLDGPIVVNGTFGEHRSGHFHAGLDLATGGQIGRPVYAPLDGWVERVRASGGGYGRSIYLRSDDGRLLVFAHLDQYVEPLARFVADAQSSSGQYEQDLWPERGRFRFKAGARIAWTGQSGAGPPHLHFEIRGSDTAYNPLLAGFALPDSLPPHLEWLRIEPLDARSFAAKPRDMVRGRLHASAPLTVSLSRPPDTLVVRGRVRAIVTVRDRFGRVGRNGAPWSVKATFGDQMVECRFDHASWAGDMSESDFVYRRGGGKRRGMRLWAPESYRPVVMRTSSRDGEAAGVFEVRDGDSARALVIRSRDVAGNSVRRSIILRPPRRGRAADTQIAVGRSAAASAPPDGRPLGDRVALRAQVPGDAGWVSLGGQQLRIDASGPSWRSTELRGVSFEGDSVASVLTAGDAAVLEAGHLPRTTRLQFHGGGGQVERWTAFSASLQMSAADDGSTGRFGRLAWNIPFEAMFEPGVFVAEDLGVAAATDELEPLGSTVALHPNDLPLRKSIQVSLEATGIDSLEGVGLYRSGGNGWGFSGDTYDRKTRRFKTTTRQIGRFALFRDTRPPRIRLRRPRWLGPDLGYSQWQLRALLTEQGSGVDRRASYFEVNGQRVPTEWDPEAKMLRWRPHTRPPAGSYRYTIVAVDRAGNEARRSSSFVLD